MPQMKDVQSTLGWCVVGLLLTQALINVIGFASPFWGQWLHDGDPEASHNLLQFWQPVTPWFSACFLVAFWHIAKTVGPIVARIGVITLGGVVVAVEIGSSLARRAGLTSAGLARGA